MKSKIVYFIILVQSFTHTFGQMPNAHWQAVLQRKTLMSEVSVKSTHSEKTDSITKENDLIKVRFENSGGDSFMNTTRSLSLKPEKENTKAILKLTRMVQKNNSFDIDTDSPFSSNPMEKMSMDHYMKFIGQAIVIDLVKRGEIRNENSKEINELWNADLPKLNSILEFSGIFQKMPNENTKIWIDSLKDDLGLYINQYSIMEEKENIQTIRLRGRYFANKLPVTSEIKPPKMPQNGETIEAKVRINAMKYEGEIVLDKVPNLIKIMTIKVNKNSTMEVLGQGITEEENLLYSVVNKVK